MRRLFPSFFTLALIGVVTTGCAQVPRFFNEYKIDIQQGNVLAQDMVAQLKPGQTRDQVRFILGTPLIADAFHQQRWDYVYTFRNGATGQTQSRRFSVFFDQDGLLQRVDGDVEVASTSELTAPAVRSRVVDLGTIPEGAAADLPPPEAPSYYRQFMDWLGW